MHAASRATTALALAATTAVAAITHTSTDSAIRDYWEFLSSPPLPHLFLAFFGDPNLRIQPAL